MKNEVIVGIIFSTNLSITSMVPIMASGIEAVSTERLEDVADFRQINAGLAGGGTQFCAPAAVSDWLMYFAHHGYPNLVEKGKDVFTQQVDLVKCMASADYMNTSLDNGTAPVQIMNGLEKYVASRGYKIKRLQYQGYRPCPAKNFAGASTPQLDWIKSSFAQKRGVVLNYGWYTYDEASNTFKRTSGH